MQLTSVIKRIWFSSEQARYEGGWKHIVQDINLDHIFISAVILARNSNIKTGFPNDSYYSSALFQSRRVKVLLLCMLSHEKTLPHRM